jgi:hypothetical protein
MSKQPSESGMHMATVSRNDLERLLGDIEDAKLIAILALEPTLAEVEEAAIWTAGDGDVLAKSGHPLTGVVANIVDILTADEEEPPPVH